MVRRSFKLAAILAAVLLFIGLAAALGTQEAYAGDYNYPDPEDIYMDYDYSTGLHFTSSELYFYSKIHDLSDAAWDASYDPDDGVLYLKNYNGSAIRIQGASGTQLTICLIGDTSTITTGGQLGIRADGVRLIITTAASDDPLYNQYDDPMLVVNQAFNNEGVDGAGIANYWSSGAGEDIVISRKAIVKIRSFSRRCNSGIYTDGFLRVTDDACLSISATFNAKDAYQGAHGEAVYALKGLSVDTYGYVDLSAANREEWKSSATKAYALYMENGTVEIDPSVTYVSMSAVGSSRAVCNETIPQRTYNYSDYQDISYDTHAVSARLFRGDYYAPGAIPINSYFFPDPDFKRYVQDIVSPYGYVWVAAEDFEDVGSVSIADYEGIQSVKGIEYFTGMDWFANEHGTLVEADFSYNPDLEVVYLWDNQLEYLNVCRCRNLIHLDVDNNLLTSLDVSDNTALETLYCGNIKTYDHYNNILVLDVSSCPNLKILYSRGNSMKALKIGNNDNLRELCCYEYGDDYLEILDLRGASIMRQTFTDYDSYEVEGGAVEYTKNDTNSWLSVDQDTRILTSDSNDISFYPVITNCKLNLSGKIGIRIYFKAPDYAKTAKIYYEGNGYSDSNAVSISLSRTNNPNYSAAQDLFVIDFPRITSREMTMRIKFVIMDGYGNPINIYYEQEDMFYGREFIYCAADWANRILRSNPSAEAVYMAQALLNYGGSAQKYLSNYNSARPANLRHYLETVNIIANEANDMEISGDPAGAGFDYIRLSLEADTAMRLYFKKSVTVTVDGASKTVYNSGNTWLSLIEGISSRNISKKFNIVATSGGKSVNIKYSVLSWANDILNRDVTAAVPTAKALYIYNRAALDYIK